MASGTSSSDRYAPVAASRLRLSIDRQVWPGATTAYQCRLHFCLSPGECSDELQRRLPPHTPSPMQEAVLAGACKLPHYSCQATPDMYIVRHSCLYTKRGARWPLEVRRRTSAMASSAGPLTAAEASPSRKRVGGTGDATLSAASLRGSQGWARSTFFVGELCSCIGLQVAQSGAGQAFGRPLHSLRPATQLVVQLCTP
jgi:hypothetical protein